MSSETEWRTVRLGDHTTVKARLGWKGLKADEYVEDGYIFLATPNLKGHHIDFHNVDYITKWRYDESPEIQLRVGDVLIVKDGSTLGICNYVRWLPRPTTLNGSIAVVRTRDTLDSEFLFHFVKGDDFQKLITLKKSGLGVPHLFQADLREFPISLPTVPEQRKIARILTTVDNLIERTEALIAKYQAIKQGMMHDLFTRGIGASGQLRPTQQQAPDLYKQSELGWIPKEWESKRLGEKLKEVDGWLQTGPFGSQLHSYEYVTEGVPVIMPQEINNGVVETETIARITPQKALQMRRHWVDTNDIVFSRRGDLCRSAAIGERESGWVCGTGCFLLRVSKKAIDAEWLSHLYRHPFIQRQVDANAVGSTMPSLNNSVMGRLQFTFPPIAEQREIARRISAIDSSIRMEEKRRSKALLTKSGLMQDLLTGKVRVKVDEAEEVAAHA